MKFVSLPSGTIVNLEQVAFVLAPGLFRDQEPEKATIQVCFQAMAVGPHGGGNLHLSLQGKDVGAFLDALEANGTTTSLTREAAVKPAK